MVKIYKITVHPDYRWSDAQISGRVFSKRSVIEMSEHDMNAEIQRAGDPKNPDRVLLIEEGEAPEVKGKKKSGKSKEEAGR